MNSTRSRSASPPGPGGDRHAEAAPAASSGLMVAGDPRGDGIQAASKLPGGAGPFNGMRERDREGLPEQVSHKTPWRRSRKVTRGQGQKGRWALRRLAQVRCPDPPGQGVRGKLVALQRSGHGCRRRRRSRPTPGHRGASEWAGGLSGGRHRLFRWCSPGVSSLGIEKPPGAWPLELVAADALPTRFLIARQSGGARIFPTWMALATRIRKRMDFSLRNFAWAHRPLCQLGMMGW